MKRTRKLLSCALVAMLLLALFPLAAQAADTTKPKLAATDGAVIIGNTLTLTFDENLDTASKPATTDFEVKIAANASALASATPTNVSNVAIADAKVTLTLAAAATNGQVASISYTPGTNKIQDLVTPTANTADPLNAVTVTNKTPVPSKDATLAEVAVKGTTVDVTGTDVTVTVPFSKQGGATLATLTGAEVTATPTDPDANAVVTKDSTGKFTITVTPEDTTATKGIYKLTVVYAEESTDVTLKSIVVLGQTARISGTTATVSVPYAIWNTGKSYDDVNDLVAGTDITATPNYVTATSATTGSGASWLITVTAEDGTTKKDYTLTVTFAAAPSSGGSSGSGSNGSWPGDNYPPAPPPPAEVLPGTPGSATPSTPSVTNPFSFRVLARSLNVRSGPGTSFAKVGTLRANDVVSIVGYSADGLWAQTQAGSWVSMAYVSQVVSVDVGDYIVTVTSGSLNVRSGPGTSNAKIGSLANNALVMVNSVTNGWAQIEFNGGIAYVSSLYLR